MLTRIIKLFDVGIIRLSGILLYDDTGSVLDTSTMKATQLGVSSIVIDNVTTLFPAENALKGKIAMTSVGNGDPASETWWQLDLLTLRQVYKLTILDTNLHNIKCFEDAQGTKEIYNKKSEGTQSLDNTTTFSATLTPYYTISSVINSGCSATLNKDYRYIVCKDSPLEACSNYFTPIPDNVWYALKFTGNKNSTKWHLITDTPCNPEESKNDCLRDHASSVKCKQDCKANGGTNCDNLPEVSDWSGWSKCVGDISRRTRTCKGVCTGVNLFEDWKCINYSFGDWGPFGPCENLSMTRFRPCIPGFNGTKIECPGSELTETKACEAKSDGATSSGLIGTGYLPIVVPMVVIFIVIMAFLVIFFRRN